MEPFLAEIDLVLCMTVFPGFGGQSFMPEVVPKVARVRAAVEAGGWTVDIEVDGGIDTTTAPEVARAGANVLVAGSAVFGDPRPWQAAEAIREAARGALVDRTVTPVLATPGADGDDRAPTCRGRWRWPRRCAA